MLSRKKLIVFGAAMTMSMAVLADDSNQQQTIDKLQQQIQAVSKELHEALQAQQTSTQKSIEALRAQVQGQITAIQTQMQQMQTQMTTQIDHVQSLIPGVVAKPTAAPAPAH